MLESNQLIIDKKIKYELQRNYNCRVQSTAIFIAAASTAVD